MDFAVRPFVNLANANIAAFARFASSPEVNNITQESADRVLTLANDNLNKVTRTRAFEEWTRALVDNYARFTQEYVNSVYGTIARTQQFLSRQVEEGSRQIARISEVTEQATERGATVIRTLSERGTEAAKTAADAAKITTEEAVDELAKAAGRARDQRSR